MLRRVLPAAVPRASASDPVDAVTRGQSAAIVTEVQEGGAEGLLRVAVRLGDIKEGSACCGLAILALARGWGAPAA